MRLNLWMPGETAALCGLLCAALTFSSGAAAEAPLVKVLRPAAAPIRLSGELAEVSGLAPASETSVYAHNDEQATIYEVDIGTGAVLRNHALGRPPPLGDFEALATVGDKAVLITSKGIIHEARLTARDRPLGYRSIDTKLDKACEVEGLSHAGDGETYFIACKHSGRRLVLRRWSEREGASRAIDVKLRDAVPNPKEFRATDLVRDPRSGTLLVLDSAAGAVLEITAQGEKVGYWRLGGDHPQAEGLALMNDGTLIVADEGRIGDGALTTGTLTIYPPRR